MIRKDIKILSDCKLRSTPIRAMILDLFAQTDRALSYGDIEKEVKENVDRVTIYRTLRTFLDHGIIHKVPDDKGELKYAICAMGCPSMAHQHHHVHFKCDRCDQTSCLESLKIPSLNLPPGFISNDVNLLVQGVCNQCS